MNLIEFKKELFYVPEVKEGYEKMTTRYQVIREIIKAKQEKNIR
jgi:hypothetical protein